jgi:hypothetical protein
MEELSTILWRLSRNIVDIVTALKKDKKIRKVKMLWIREKITNFEYKEGGVSWQASPEYFEREEWDWRDVFRIVEPKIKGLSLYVDTYKRISEIYNTKEAQAEFWLSHFAHETVRKALYDDISEESLLSSVTIFVNDLEKNPLTWNVSVELEGIWLREEEIEIRRGLKIRRPRPKDFEFEWPFEHIFIPRMQPLIGHPSAILEITQRAKFQPFVWDELEKLIIALRLYKVGSVVKGKTIWKPKSILLFGGTTWIHLIQPIIYRYSLGSEDSSNLRNFLNKITPLLPIKNGRIETIDHISISLQRYNDALFKGDPTERLTYGIMGLEALFLKAPEREELAHRLAQRVAKCLSVLGQQPLEAYRNIKRSYEVRSDFTHGSLIIKEKHQEISKLADEIVKYLRNAILMFLELKGKVEKEGLLSTVDNSLLHPKATAKLEKLIKEHCHITQSIKISE